jgi:hypothetical protein
LARPSFKEVPEHWKAPVGPYHQAPAEYGGEWWLVNPFTTAEPWLFDEMRAQQKGLPPEFAEIFGPRPTMADYQHLPKGNWAYRAALTLWQQELKYFRRAGFPEWASEESRAAPDKVFEAWGMGAPRYYEGRYGWMARFVDSQIPDYDITAWTALNWAHGAVAHYQIALVQRGIVPEKLHPLFPDFVPTGREDEEATR